MVPGCDTVNKRITWKGILTVVLCAINFGIGCAYLSPLRHTPVWDLPQFYFAGKLVRQGQVASIYDRAAYVPLVEELRRTDERASQKSIYFNRPAFEAPLFVPLAYLTFHWAKVLAILANLALLGVLVWILPTWCGGGGYTRICLFVFMPFLYSVAFGQDTLVLTLFVSGALYLTLQDRQVPAGVLFALALFKPHLILAIPIALAFARKWRALGVFLLSGGMLALLSFALVGSRGVLQWLELLQAPSTDSVPMLMGNTRALGLHFGPWAGMLGAGVAVACFGVILKCNSSVDKLTAAIVVGLLLSPHTYCQDYSLLAVAALASGRPIARYVVLLPWPYFYPRPDIVPFTLVALGYLITLAAEPLIHILVAWARKTAINLSTDRLRRA